LLLVSAAALPAALGLSACDRGGGGQPAQPAPPAQSSQPARADNPAAADGPLRSDQVQAVVQTLQAAPQQGFAPSAFGDVQQIAALAASTDPAEQARGQEELRKAIIAYARAQHGLGLPTDQFPKEWGVRPPPYDAGAELRAALVHDGLAEWLKSLPPPSPRYAALVQALAAYQKLAAQGGWKPVPQGPPLRPGARGTRVAALRARLAVEDPALAGQPPSDRFDAGLAAALSRFQSRYGLKDAGFVGPETYAALNTPVEGRIDQIRANLQRWRWVPRDPPPTRIEVDAASGAMDYYNDGRDVMHMLAAAGKPDDETPILISKITDVVLNPAWHVPADIAAKEIYPKARRDHGYFAREGFTKGSSSIAPVIQKPGPKNALGQVKFEFDNAYGVYMHDTPAKTAFNLAQRSVSHGCVRLQHALDLAKALLSTAPGWSPERIDQALATDQTQTIDLPQPVPIYLLYWTAYVQDGQVVLRQDPYGWDAMLVRLLDASSSGQG
jgi:murein L,D-transpeptidase YcbB/YkuD